MLVDLRHGAQMAVPAMVIMVIVVIVILMAVARLLLHPLHVLDHSQGLSLGLRRLQNRLHPLVGLAAQIQKQVAALHLQDIRRGGLIGVALRSRRQQQLHLRQISGGSPGKVIGREHRSHDVQLSVLRLLDIGRCASGQHCQHQKQDQTFLHSGFLAI